MFIQPKGEFFNPDAPGGRAVRHRARRHAADLPDGLAKKVPAGARLIFQMHYTPNGKAVARSKFGWPDLRKKPPRHRVLTKPVYSAAFITRLDRIPAGADNYKMESEHVFDEDAHLLHFMPHMHLRGKDFLYEVIYPDGKKEIAAVGAALRLQLAERLPPRRAPGHAEGHEAALRRALR